MRQFIVYSLGQASAYAIDLLVFILLRQIAPAENVVVLHLFGKITSALFAFFFHKRISFAGGGSRSGRAEAVLFTSVVFANMVITAVLLWGISRASGVPPAGAKILSDLIGVVVTYLALRLVFTKGRE